MVDTQLDARYSDPGATAVPWARAEERLRAAGGFWISTVRPDGRPHVTPLIAVWLDGALDFSTRPAQRQPRHLATHPHCVLTAGSDPGAEGFDGVVDGD